jgi:hypothetical protein
MALLPFTTAGVDQKQQELYALSDVDLLTQAKAISAGIAGWLDSNFTLTSQQKAWIAAAPALVQFNWGTVIGGAMSARRPIKMAAPPKYGPPRRTKQIIIDFIGSLSYFPPVTGPGKLEGTLEVRINYNLVD